MYVCARTEEKEKKMSNQITQMLGRHFEHRPRARQKKRKEKKTNNPPDSNAVKTNVDDIVREKEKKASLARHST